MKQLKVWSMMMLVVMMMPLLSACGDDAKEEGGIDVKKAVGTWMCTKSTDTYQGKSYDGLLVGAQITIKSDGTYSSTSSSFGTSGTYTINGNTITAKNNKGDTFVVDVSISGDSMTWKGTASTGVQFSYVFVRE